MFRTEGFGLARFTARLFARSAFVGSLVLALTIAVVSFLTACKCNEPFIGEPGVLTNPALKSPTQPGDGKDVLPPGDSKIATPSRNTKDN